MAEQIKSPAEIFSKLLTAGVLTTNEVRSKLGLDPHNGTNAVDIVVPLQTASSAAHIVTISTNQAFTWPHVPVFPEPIFPVTAAFQIPKEVLTNATSATATAVLVQQEQTTKINEHYLDKMQQALCEWILKNPNKAFEEETAASREEARFLRAQRNQETKQPTVAVVELCTDRRITIE